MENFIVSARKYRPATFESVVGQEHITSTLRNAIARGQLAHAYLFCGPRGVGKTTCARIFAKAINCQNPSSEAEACNACESCLAFNEGRSFNIHELDAASNNSVEDIRNLTDQVRIPPQIGTYSVYIIDEVHMLSLQAFNAFLKTLEEPPAHAIFILATTEKHKIIPTILSRCQTYDFSRIRVEDGVKYLQYIASQEGVTHDDESLHIIAQKADGGMRDALSMFDKVVSFCGSNLTATSVAETLNVLDYDTYFQITEFILAGDYKGALLLLDEVLRKGFSCATFLGGLTAHLRDLLVCKETQTATLLEVTGTVAQRYLQQAAQTPLPLLFGGMNLLSQIDQHLRIASNQRLHVELGLMKLCGLGQKKNNDLTLEGEPALLPPLSPAAAPQANSAAPQTSGAAATQPAPQAAAVEAQPEVAERAEVAVVTEEVTVEQGREGTIEATAVTEGTTEAATSPPPPHPSTTSPRGVETAPSANSISGNSISGNSISSILSRSTQQQVAHKPSKEESSTLAPTSLLSEEEMQERLQAGCARYGEELMASRPRMGTIFSDAIATGSRIELGVANESSKLELEQSLSEATQRIGELAEVTQSFTFEITMQEGSSGARLIKVDDRLRHLTEMNPELNNLRALFALEVE